MYIYGIVAAAKDYNVSTGLFENKFLSAQGQQNPKIICSSFITVTPQSCVSNVSASVRI